MSAEPRRTAGGGGGGGSARRVGIALVATLLAVSVLAAAESPSLEVTAPTAAVSVGDRVTVRAAARGDGELQWGELKVAVRDGGDWAVADGPREITGSRPPVWELVLVPLAVGDLELPAITTTARVAGEAAVEVTPASPPQVTVATVLPAEGEPEPAPLRAPIGVAGLPWEWLLPILLVLAPLVAVGWWLWRRRRRVALAGAARRALPPLAELEALARELRARIDRDGPDVVCDRLAHGLRRYLERRTGEPALEMTSFELRLLGRRSGWSDEVQRGVQLIMKLVDGVRFGRRAAIESELAKAIDTAVAAGRAHERQLAPEPADDVAEAAG